MFQLSPTIVIATRNPGKLREFRALLEPAGLEISGLADLGIQTEVDEIGESFSANARIKALGYSHETGLPVLADDSGLEVFSLGGRPGVASARYAGPGASDEDRVRKLLAELESASGPRAARFVCALALARKGLVLHEAQGECRGEIAREPRGSNGFGYDPIFLFPELGRTLAELSEDEKNLISHRAVAIRNFLAHFGR